MQQRVLPLQLVSALSASSKPSLFLVFFAIHGKKCIGLVLTSPKTMQSFSKYKQICD